MKHKYVYCIFYLEQKYYQRIKMDLKERGYSHIRPIIPTVSVLKKTHKGKMIFEDVPVLFNYGFMRMPSEYAYSRPFLNKLKRDIPGIRTFLRDTKTMHERKKKARIDNAEDFDDFSIVATCTREEVRRFKRISKENKKYSVDDLINLKPGDYLVLKGYPYEGVDATVKDVDFKNRWVKLILYPENGKMEIRLPFDNVLYSVYQNYDPDKLFANQREYDPNQITAEAITNLLESKKR